MLDVIMFSLGQFYEKRQKNWAISVWINGVLFAINWSSETRAITNNKYI